MIRNGAWLLLLLAWFWVTDRHPDPAAVKNLFLPAGILVVLLLAPGTVPRGWPILLGAGFFLWSLYRAYPFPSFESEWFLGTTALAFMLGLSGARPGFLLALGGLAVGILKGWDDLLFLRNWGGGIPFTTTSFFLHKNLFTLILSPALLLLLGALLEPWESRRVRLSAAVIFIAGFFLLLLSDGRGALLGFGVGGALFVLLGRWSSPRHRKVGILVGVFFLLAVGWSFRARVPQTLLEIEAIARSERVSTSVPDRFRPWVWAGALRLWREAPWTGIGVGAFRYRIEAVLDPWLDQLRDRTMKVDVAHSHWLQTAVERGKVGLLLEVSLLVVAVAGAARARRIPLVAALVAMSIHALVGEGFDYPMGAILWWYLIGLGSSQWTSVGAFSTRIPAILGVMLLAYPFWIQARTLRGEALVRPGTGSPRVDVLADAIELAPGSATVLVEVARYQFSVGDIHQARNTLERARALYPWLGSTTADLPLSQIWYQLGVKDSSLVLLRRLVSLYPNDPVILKAMAVRKRSEQGCEDAVAFRDSAGSELLAVIRLAHPAPGKPPQWWVGVLAPDPRDRWHTELGTRASRFQLNAWKEWRDLRLPGCEP